MTKTYTQLQKQIAKLQKEAESVKAKEVAGVVGRIKVAIAHYGLTPDDLFPAPGANGLKAVKAPEAPKAAKVAKVAKAAKKAPSTPKYTDGAGNTWTGIGKRPRWFLAAIEGGKMPRDLEIAAPAA
jgi:DNA-binding protein H-NS